MSELAARRVRIKADPFDFDAVMDVGATPHRQLRIPRGNAVQVEVGCFYGEEPMDLSNLASITFEIRDAATRLAAAVAETITPSDPSWNDSITYAAFAAATAQNFLINLSSAQLNQAATPAGTTYFLVISALTTDDPIKQITLCAGDIVIWEDGAGQGDVPEPPESEIYLTDVQIDALYMRKVPTNGNWRVNSSTGFLELWDIGTTPPAWRAVWLNNGVLVTP